MTSRYVRHYVKLLLQVIVILMVAISTSCTKQCKDPMTDRDDSVIIRNIGIKLCQLKCAESGECLSIQYNIDTLTCRLSKVEEGRAKSSRKSNPKEGHISLARSHSDVSVGSCSSGCSFGQRCLKTRSGKSICLYELGQLVTSLVAKEKKKEDETELYVLAQCQQKKEKRCTVKPRNKRRLLIMQILIEGNEDTMPKNWRQCITIVRTFTDVKNFPEKSPQHGVDKEASPLHDACRKGNLTRVRRILSRGSVDINSRGGRHGKTPLMVAVQEGHCRIFEFLLRKRANKSQEDDDGKNFLHWACKGGHVGMMECILPHYDVDINNKQVTPLMQAAWRGYRDVCEFLVCMGANVSECDDDGDSVLHWACKGGHLDMVKYLLSQCSLDINSSGEGGRTPLMDAALWGHTDVGQLLMSMGANLTQVDDFGDNILHWGSKYGRLDLMKSVLSQGSVDINSRGLLGKTPLMNAAFYGKRKVFDLLVSLGCQFHLVDNKGENILHKASSRGRVEMVKYILSQNMTDVNARDKNGKTAAMIAQHTGNVRVYNLLVSQGCPVT